AAKPDGPASSELVGQVEVPHARFADLGAGAAADRDRVTEAGQIDLVRQVGDVERRADVAAPEVRPVGPEVDQGNALDGRAVRVGGGEHAGRRGPRGETRELRVVGVGRGPLAAAIDVETQVHLL